MDEPIQKMEKDCSAIVDAQFPEIDAHAKVDIDILHHFDIRETVLVGSEPQFVIDMLTFLLLLCCNRPET